MGRLFSIIEDLYDANEALGFNHRGLHTDGIRGGQDLDHLRQSLAETRDKLSSIEHEAMDSLRFWEKKKAECQSKIAKRS